MLLEEKLLTLRGSMISVKTKSDFSKMENYLKRINDKRRIMSMLNKYGERGVDLLSSATPVDSSETANSWSYEINENRGRYSVQFDNSNVNDGVNIAIILQYGHGTKNGGFVQGRDYINPALKTAFDELMSELTREVGRL